MYVLSFYVSIEITKVYTVGGGFCDKKQIPGMLWHGQNSLVMWQAGICYTDPVYRTSFGYLY